MWVRVGYFEGVIAEGQVARFTKIIENVIVPGIAVCPNVHSAKALWPRKFEDRPVDLVCQIVVEFDSEAAIEVMLASPERNAMRARLIDDVLPLFNGRISHINFQTA